MKKLFITLTVTSLLFSISFAQVIIPPENPRKVQLAILFDTSNSMDGLIDQAKSRIWNIVNEVTTLRHAGQAPTIEIALYQYGNDGLSPSNNYIEQVLGLTTDLDDVSAKLFGLTTNGGSEFCGAVIGESLDELAWSTSLTDLKMIYIAGNEPFNQGPVAFETVCKKALAKGVFINTIYCGEYNQGVREFWKQGATCSEGDYFNIDSDKAIVHIDTPYDVKINTFNDSLNTTYLGYGVNRISKKANQTTQDANAGSMSQEAVTERSIVKSKKAAYNNASWDLVDAADEGVNIEEIAEEELPEEFKGKTAEEKKVLIEEKKVERERYQAEIAKLAVDRQEYIEIELKKRAEGSGTVEDDFGTSINKSIMEKALENGFEEETLIIE